MNHSVWNSLDSPCFILAPMEDVTDTVFRRVVADCGRPHLFMTEFTSSSGITSEGRDQVKHRLRFYPGESPIVAQIWGTDPESHLETAKYARELGFDGIDINMGCPVQKIVKLGACSALIKNPALAAEIIAATKEGAAGLDVSVKTRIGFNKVETESWIQFLLEQNLSALTVHGRIAVEMSKKPADWDQIGLSVKIRDSMSKQCKIIGNGDVRSLDQAKEYVVKYGVDGVMIGRGIFENPWIFNPAIDPESISKEMRISLMAKHVEMFTAEWGDQKNFAILKKFFKVYINGFPGAAKLRAKFMEVSGPEQFWELYKENFGD